MDSGDGIEPRPGGLSLCGRGTRGERFRASLLRPYPHSAGLKRNGIPAPVASSNQTDGGTKMNRSALILLFLFGSFVLLVGGERVVRATAEGGHYLDDSRAVNSQWDDFNLL